MTKRIFRAILMVSIAVLAANLTVVMSCLYGDLNAVQTARLRDGLELAACGVELDGRDFLAGLPDGRYRMTWVARDGTVIFDTQADPEDMESHGDREEIQQALAMGEGSSTRYSRTMMEKTVYLAMALGDGTVLRVSVRQATALTLALKLSLPILAVAGMAAALSALLAHWMAGRIVAPLNQLDLDHPMENDAYEELAPLLARIHRQHQQIAEQLRSLEEKNDEFAQITGSMREGLVLLDGKGTVLSVNPAAQGIFHVGPSCVGQDFLTIDRSCEVSRAIQAAMADGHGEVHASLGGREYQFDISRIVSNDGVTGAVLLAFDVTEQAFAERSRREFTANVSHELKTPLQSIVGSAELLENGLVKPEDMPRFIGHIRAESTRLVTLIEDIIRLSQLDEGITAPSGEVDLYEVAEEVVSHLRGIAEDKRVRMTLAGSSAVVDGVRGLLYEMVYNLCDNAVKYNVEGGAVDITVSMNGRRPSVSVKDTGIGIPEEYQPKIFERFFRVDKSRSKASGGTGLGLAIVKHAAQYHHAGIELRSQVGGGTELTITFPAREPPAV